MVCCQHCQDADQLFDQKVAESDLRKYQLKGADGTTRILLEILKSAGVAGMSLLDIGGGIGVIQHELKAAGVTNITSVDASRAYLKMAQAEAQKQGYADNANYIYGDFVALAEQLEAADIVTMDRVICCYPDVVALADAAASHTKQYLGLVYPRNNLWTKIGIPLINLYMRVRGSAFRSYVHPTGVVEDIAAANNLHKIAKQKTWLWQVVVYERTQPAS